MNIVTSHFDHFSKVTIAILLTLTALVGSTTQAAPNAQLQQLIQVRQSQALTLESEIKRLEPEASNPIVAEQIELKKLGLAKLKAGTNSLRKAAEHSLSVEDEALLEKVGEVFKLAANTPSVISANKASDSLEPRLSEHSGLLAKNPTTGSATDAVAAKIAAGH